ncbi:circadian clock protein KaiC [Pseudoduganella namucuonensis]|uniref:non-specific serine/threonine protein kinase n=1 Tax=Pseudoduganella namucuonensis TaxID=1035707 RepID=A0A1I7H6A1_9BURK|nr:circadian clock protein KaiC [Pseudoduganella namucuonensis]SFU56230.1 circadian clock protein KaiC [Pseudoduganella namucuonensis]
MKQASTAPPQGCPKALTGITGLNEMTDGGLPMGRTTLLAGGPGSGKTILALQFLAHGARDCGEPGIFVAFEETSQRIVANAGGFGWDLPSLLEKKVLYFLDAQPAPDLVLAGNFDLSGMLAALEGQAGAMRSKRIVIDALDIVLALLPDAMAKRREIYRLHDWLLRHRMTAIITAKTGEGAESVMPQSFGFMQFMVDCSIVLNHSVVQGVSQRNLRVQKYRGSAFDENESPFLISKRGFEVAVARTLGHVDANVTNERVSSGIERLDTMLGGGYYRGASVLITGFPGTAKTTLSGAFAEAACRRGEPTMFVSFDSDGSEVVRNLSSVGIALDAYIQSGCLSMISARTITGSAETYLVRIKMLAQEHGARCLVIDPVSTLSKSGNELTAHSVAERLIDWSKAQGITLVCTSLLDEMSNQSEGGSPLQISTLADTWIHLNYLVQAGERNRGMSIIKSRGTAHSNQVRELILSDTGVTLADTYSAGGEVLMGTLRWEKESAERVSAELAEAAAQLKQVQLDAEEAELEVRLKSVQTELVAKQVEKALLIRAIESREREAARGRSRMAELRGADLNMAAE